MQPFVEMALLSITVETMEVIDVGILGHSLAICALIPLQLLNATVVEVVEIFRGAAANRQEEFSMFSDVYEETMIRK